MKMSIKLGAWLFGATLVVSSVSSFATEKRSATQYTKTRYPIVLVHGMFGFDSALGVDYWYGIVSDLRRSGAEVYVAQVTALEDSVHRGEELLHYLEELKAITGHSAFNLIGHSQGGPTSRYVAAVRPDLVKSVSSVASPHKGSKVADLLMTKPGGSMGDRLLEKVSNGLAKLIGIASGSPQDKQDFQRSVSSLSTYESALFNAQFPAGIPSSFCGEGKSLVSGVRYYSWAGSSTLTNVLDASDYALSATGLAFSEENDGMVARCSSHLGRVIRDNFKMNHLDQINHFFGIHHLFETDPVTVYRQHANRLQLAGL
ncbi:lipase family alpha/beta hydrolase [Zooshikella sp. RANM57]|uniref:lipase family alpha/beta hydrolase n=1 Tax=Zooshikella sp. RANM57 TaxID=3425863 RepID=UPI003D6E3C9B